MSNAKFKLNDRVIYTLSPKDKGIIVALDNSTHALVKLDNSSTLYLNVEDLELIPTGMINKNLTTLPTDSDTRKNYPMLSGCLKYFPAALAGVSNISKLGNDKHNPGEPLHHARGKSTDHGDCIIRHLTDTEDLMAAYNRKEMNVTAEMILIEASQLAWRVLAYSQELHEKFGSPLAPGAKNASNK